MERLTKRTMVFAGVLLAAGAIFALSPKPNFKDKNETWMEQRAPKQVPGFRFAASPENPECSYKMDKLTYDTLRPYGIVARKYESADKTFDVVLIASREKESFHDPRVCFTAQGWNIVREERVQIPTGRGVIPASFAYMQHAQYGDNIAVFFYRGPGGFTNGTTRLKWDIFLEQLKNSENIDGVFYRFMPLYRGATKEQLAEFIATYMDASAETSGGYF
ncbi:MAG: exosortase-associated EpsI family protein [Fimbriimonadaceae bacterium]|nr:exosortase-associated EpsI family protein [Fimbriimonadaceae bacterium]